MIKKLKRHAKSARSNAYVPYSGFSLGAALLTDSGKIFTGCNIEIASYGLTNCAERTAIFNAVSEGEKNFKVLLLLADTDEPIFPCGSCRQVIEEFTNNMDIILCTSGGEELIVNSGELLPSAFSKGDLKI